MSTSTNISDFNGGLSLVDSRNLDDNQFETLKNMSYSKDKNVQTRLGIKTFGTAIGSDPISSLFYFENDITGVGMLLATAGTKMYKYNSGTTVFDEIKTGLTEFETDGTTRTRWSFAVYLNIVYMCNGIDAYADYDGTTYTEHAAQPKVRYLKYMGDAIYGGGADAAPSTMYATNSGAADAETLNANSLVVGGDELGRINGFKDLGNILLVFKDKKIYSVAGDLASSEAIDGQNGGYGHRAIQNVENSLFYYSDAGVDTVKARSGISGAAAMATEPKSNDLRQLLDKISPANYNHNAGNYIAPLNNYYFSFDTGNDSVPESTLVYSSLVGAWSQYLYPALYDYSEYKDSNGNFQYLVAPASGGQVMEIETGFTDFGLGIETELKTKKWDLGELSLWKTFNFVTIEGFKNEGSSIAVEVLVDDDVVGSADITDTFADITATPLTIGSSPIGDFPIGGGANAGDELDLYPFLVRVPLADSGPTIQVKMSCSSNPNQWTLNKIQINRDDEAIDVFPSQNIA